MRREINIPEFYQESWNYLVKCRVKPQHYLLRSGLNGVYEAARMFGYLNRKADEKAENPFINNFFIPEYQS